MLRACRHLAKRADGKAAEITKTKFRFIKSNAACQPIHLLFQGKLDLYGPEPAKSSGVSIVCEDGPSGHVHRLEGIGTGTILESSVQYINTFRRICPCISNYRDLMTRQVTFGVATRRHMDNERMPCFPALKRLLPRPVCRDRLSC